MLSITYLQRSITRRMPQELRGRGLFKHGKRLIKTVLDHFMGLFSSILTCQNPPVIIPQTKKMLKFVQKIPDRI